MSHQVVVMYLGQIVERRRRQELFEDVRCIPIPRRCSRRCCRAHVGQAEEIELKGEVPSPLNPPIGLPLPPALPLGHAALRAAGTAMREVSPGHAVACHLFDGA